MCVLLNLTSDSSMIFRSSSITIAFTDTWRMMLTGLIPRLLPSQSHSQTPPQPVSFPGSSPASLIPRLLPSQSHSQATSQPVSFPDSSPVSLIPRLLPSQSYSQAPPQPVSFPDSSPVSLIPRLFLLNLCSQYLKIQIHKKW